ncbi:MAG: RNA polymerase sigma factor [Pseudomonadales bacterium]|nr:RNA polymerase sigma factor [Pseudomonadales bacterium]
MVEKLNTLLEDDVDQAVQGDQQALTRIVNSVSQDVFQLAMRFLWHPQDAEDATQEILIKIITNLSRFRGESRFQTWVYRIASNTLMTVKAKKAELQALSFEAFSEDLARDLSVSPEATDSLPFDARLQDEVRIGCTLAMLLCLDRKHRLAYILGEIMELEHEEASDVLSISKVAYRKQISRARSAIQNLMTSRCGLVEPRNPCRCNHRVSCAVERGHVDPENLIFASAGEQTATFPEVLETIRALDASRRAAALYQSHPDLFAGVDFAAWLRKLVSTTEQMVAANNLRFDDV